MDISMSSQACKRAASVVAVAFMLGRPAAEAAPGSPLNAPFRVDEGGSYSSLYDIPRSPALARSADGSFAVVWSPVDFDATTEPGGLVYARSYAADGTPRSSPVQVAAEARDTQASIAIDSAGTVLVGWLYQKRKTPDRLGIRVQRLNADGTPLGAAIDVQGPGRLLDSHWLAMAPSGDFVVSWLEYKQLFVPLPIPPYGYGFGLFYSQVHAQRYDRNGAPRGGDILVHASALPTASPSTLNKVRVAMNANGDFVTAWAEPGYTSAAGFNTTIKARLYASTGTAQSSVLTVAPAASPRVDSPPSVSVAADGSFAIAYAGAHEIGPGSFSGKDIYVKRYSASGTAQSDSVMTNEALAGSYPAVAIDSMGNSAIAWLAASSADANACCLRPVLFQLQGPGGVLNGSNITASTAGTDEGYSPPAVASDANGEFVLLWAESEKLMAQRFSGQ